MTSELIRLGYLFSAAIGLLGLGSHLWYILAISTVMNAILGALKS